MNTLGRLMWDAVSRKLGAQGVVKHGLADMSEAIGLSERAIRYKLNGQNDWLKGELVNFQAKYDDDAVQDFLDGEFKTARQNGRKEIHHGEQSSKVPPLRTDAAGGAASIDPRILQAMREVLDDYFREGRGRNHGPRR